MLGHFVDVAVEDDRLVHASDFFATIGAVSLPFLPLLDAVLAERMTAVKRRGVDEQFRANSALQLHLHGFLQVGENRLSGLQFRFRLVRKRRKYLYN